jgi:hypothetical protein
VSGSAQSNELGLAIAKALGIPDPENIFSFEIRFQAGELVKVKTMRELPHEDGIKLKAVFSEYTIQKKPEGA